MGNCPSSFRAQFKPDHENTTKCQTDIILSPVMDGEGEKSYDCPEEMHDCSGAEAIEITAHTTNGNPGSAAEMSEIHIPLKVEDVDLCTAENTERHHTCNFNSTRRTSSMILRRGFTFRLNITLNRSYDHEKDVMCLVFTVKDAVAPSFAQNTQVLIPLQSEESILTPGLWQARIISSADNAVNIEVTSSPSSVIGEWILEIGTRSKDDFRTNGFHYKVADPIILLFNPWCEGDSVYLSVPEYCEEYVMNECGLIWRGTHSRLRQCVWNFAQFEENILECCLYLLTHVGSLSVVARGDPVLVAKHIAAVVSHRNQSTGLLVGNWSGNYKGGLPPTSWGGSQQILESFYRSKKPVKYGQCWVYAGILTTVFRALGIPSRPVTNYLSARSTYGSMIVDCIIGNENRLVDNPRAGSVWSFHVWTEAWMQRPDLGPDVYNGWQVVDVTTHENHDGSRQCGPTSVAAIKREEKKKPFDTSNLLAEVSAEKAYWRHHGPDQPLKLMKTTTDQVGLCISTKAVGKFEREDITNEYKNSECEVKVRDAMLCSFIENKNAFTRYYANDDFQDVNFIFSLPDDVTIGETFAVKLKASNKNDDKSYSIKISLRVDSALYTGEVTQLVKKDSFEITLSPGVEQEMTMNVQYSEYAKTLSDQCLFTVCASAHVIETGFDFFAQDDFRVRMPHISVQIDGEISHNQPITITASFTNPLPTPLKSGLFKIGGPGFGKPLAQKLKGNVQPKADAKVNCKVTPKSSGMKTLVVKFQSKELQDVEGYHVMNVKATDGSEKESNSHL